MFIELQTWRIICKQVWYSAILWPKSTSCCWCTCSETSPSLFLLRYRERAQLLSQIHKDQPGHPVSRAVYWISYILRHRGADHLRSAVYEIPTYQYFLLDVAVVIGVCLVLLGYCLYRIGKCIKSRVGRGSSPVEKVNGHCHNGIPNGKHKKNGHVRSTEKKLK